MSDRFQQLRLLEALLFASAEPLGRGQIQRHLPEGADLDALMADLASFYANRGVNLVRLGDRWALRTAADLAPLMQIEKAVMRKPSRAAVETLAIIAYHQPVTRAEVEEIRGVELSRGTLDTLLEAGWIKPRGRRRTPGRPVTWGTTGAFLDHFGLESLEALPGVAELKAAGLLDTRPAVMALGMRGYLPAAGEIAGERDFDAADGLPASDFGTAAAREEAEQPADDSGAAEPHDDEEEDDPVTGASREIEAACADEAAQPIGDGGAAPPKAARASGKHGG